MNNRYFDIIVVGGCLAGSSLGGLLALAGHSCSSSKRNRHFAIAWGRSLAMGCRRNRARGATASRRSRGTLHRYRGDPDSQRKARRRGVSLRPLSPGGLASLGFPRPRASTGACRLGNGIRCDGTSTCQSRSISRHRRTGGDHRRSGMEADVGRASSWERTVPGRKSEVGWRPIYGSGSIIELGECACQGIPWRRAGARCRVHCLIESVLVPDRRRSHSPLYRREAGRTAWSRPGPFVYRNRRAPMRR